MNRQLRALACAACLALTVAIAGCTASGGQGQPGPATGTASERPVIVVGSFNFPESVVLAYLYADALADDQAVTFEPRSVLVDYIRGSEGLALCGRGAACPG